MKYFIPLLAVILVLACGTETKEDTQQIDTEQALIDNNEEHHVDSLLKIGGNITSETQSVLLQNVTAAMQSGGKEHAVRYCNLKATDLVDSLSKLYECEIYRISEKNRNPNNAPKTELDKKMLKMFAESNNVQDKDVIHNDGKHIYYQPIFIQKGACMNCHGDIHTAISEEFYAVIKDKYPDDKAIGYNMGDLRGTWKIVFN